MKSKWKFKAIKQMTKQFLALKLQIKMQKYFWKLTLFFSEFYFQRQFHFHFYFFINISVKYFSLTKQLIIATLLSLCGYYSTTT